MNSIDTYITSEEQRIRALLDEVADPEIPVLSVNDLGIVRDVRVKRAGQSVEITITPTYSGCPAMDMISIGIRMVLLQNGYSDIQISTVLSPAWTTDWLSEAGKQKLRSYGIAPPGLRRNSEILFEEAQQVQCPLCQSYNTQRISEFGSTACKSLYRCNECHEPFDHFKCH